MASIVDRPKASNQDDLLEIEKYTNGLIKFIESSATPITIGVQGEWGSGKTSLLNTIKEDLCDKDGAKHYPIWLNTWEYSLLSSPDETLIKIISGLVNQIGDLTQNQNNENGKKAAAALGSLMKGFGGVMGGFGGKAIEMAGDAIESSTTNKSSDNSIKALRIALQDVIDEAIKNSDKKAFIFFIDDLDRLDPTVAVNILELIKNLFDLKNCIFVLAIDYGVVVKGLQSKFGKMTDENEWEFRAFFDKIIQLPFSMPTSDYNIEKYLQALLINVNYFTVANLQNKEILSNIADTVGLSVGTNPRALKRLANSVALIEIIRGDEKITAEERVIEFALICIQIAYPLIYGLIQKESDFTGWNDQFVYTVLKNKKIDINDLDTLKETEEFDEVWEQNVWKICQVSSFLKQRSYQLSRLLNFIKNNIPDNINEDMNMTLDRLLSMSSVTSVSTDSVVKSAKGIFQFKSIAVPFMNEILIPKLSDDLKNMQSKFEISSNSNAGHIYFIFLQGSMGFSCMAWRDNEKITIGLNHNSGNKKTTKHWFETYMSDLYPNMIYSGRNRYSYLELDTYKFTSDEMSQGEDIKMEIYKNMALKSFEQIIPRLSQHYIETEPIFENVKGFVNKLDSELKRNFSVEDGWVVDMGNALSLNMQEPINIYHSDWKDDTFAISIETGKSLFRNIYLGIRKKNSNFKFEETLSNNIFNIFQEKLNGGKSYAWWIYCKDLTQYENTVIGEPYYKKTGKYAYPDEASENEALAYIVAQLVILKGYNDQLTELANAKV
jgi:ABC-type phosphonate transport system ATPase subunit